MTLHVYRCRDLTGRLLYIGCTNNVERRMKAHGRRFWSVDVASVDVVTFADHDEARAEERRAIRAEHPRFNILGRWETRHGWTASDYADHLRALSNTDAAYTPKTQRQMAATRAECLSRFGVDIAQEVPA